jgi:hypothetical protein
MFKPKIFVADEELYVIVDTPESEELKLHLQQKIGTNVLVEDGPNSTCKFLTFAQQKVSKVQLQTLLNGFTAARQYETDHFKGMVLFVEDIRTGKWKIETVRKE